MSKLVFVILAALAFMATVLAYASFYGSLALLIVSVSALVLGNTSLAPLYFGVAILLGFVALPIIFTAGALHQKAVDFSPKGKDGFNSVEREIIMYDLAPIAFGFYGPEGERATHVIRFNGLRRLHKAEFKNNIVDKLEQLDRLNYAKRKR